MTDSQSDLIIKGLNQITQALEKVMLSNSQISLSLLAISRQLEDIAKSSRFSAVSCAGWPKNMSEERYNQLYDEILQEEK